MVGNKTGGKLAAQANLANNPNHYKEIGAKGGRNGRTGGFYKNSELARRAGAKGGQTSRRKPTTHCPMKHEYTPENTYNFTRNGRPARRCRACYGNYDYERRRIKRMESTNA